MQPTREVGLTAAVARHFRRNAVYGAAFLMDCALAFATIGCNYLAKDRFGAGPAGLGLLTLISAGSYVVFCLIFGKLSDRWGRRRLVAFGALLDAAALVLLAGAGSFWHLCALMGLFSLGQGAYWPSLEADIADNSSPSELPRRLGKFNVSWCLGFVVGWPIGGVVGEAAGQQLVPLLGAALAAAALAVYLARRLQAGETAEPAPDGTLTQRAASRAAPFWAIALVLNFAAMGLSGTLRSQVPEVTGGERSGLGGLYGAVFFGAQVLVFVLLAFWRGWHYRAAPLVGGSLLAVAGAALCGLCPDARAFAAGCALGGLGCGVAYYSSIYYSVAVASAHGHRGGVHEAVLGAGGAVVPFAGGAMAAAPLAKRIVAWPAGVPFLLAGAVMFAAAAAGALIYLRLRLRAAAAVPPRQ